MSGKKRRDKKVFSQLSLKEQLLGVQQEKELVVDKREIPVTIRMNSKIMELLDALIELDIFESRSEAIANIVETTVSLKYNIFKSLKTQADDLMRRREAAREMASKVISGNLE